MPQFQYGDDPEASSDAGSTTAMGVLNGMPGLNFLFPGITEGIAAGQKSGIMNQEIGQINAIDQPQYQNYNGLAASYAGDVNPTLYGTPEAAQATLAQESPEGRAAMMEALKDIGRVTDQSVGSQQAQRRQQAEMDARQLANSREQAIKQDAMRRGQVGGAADMLSRQQSAQAAANQNLNAGLQNASAAALQELAGTQAKGQLGGALRSGDQAMAFNNADILNKFAQYNTGARNAAAQHNADTQTAAAMANRAATQDYLNNQTKLGMAKIAANNDLGTQAYENAMQKQAMKNQALNNKIGIKQDNATNARSAGQEEWQNQKDVYKMLSSFMGGGMGGGM